jgi:hypothetical protein
MAHVELIAAFTSFAGLVLVWLAVPTTRTAQRAAEPAPAAALQQIAA